MAMSSSISCLVNAAFPAENASHCRKPDRIRRIEVVTVAAKTETLQVQVLGGVSQLRLSRQTRATAKRADF